jgi:hypothetical protein
VLEPVTSTTRVRAQGVGVGIYITRAVAEAAGIEVGDVVEYTIRRVRRGF